MTLEINRLCQAFNRCALLNCIGTPVNLKRPLCGLGGLVRTYGAMSLQGFKGAWVILVELLGLVVKLSTRKVGGVDIAFPEDAFMSQICVAKDGDAHLFSIATSMLNSALQLGSADVGYIYHGAVNVDTNADAALTVTMMAVTSFLHQMSLLPIYTMVATHQILMCEVNGMLAVIDATGFRIRVQSASLSDASAIIAGQCLTVGDEMLARYPTENQNALGYKLSSTLQNMLNLVLIQEIQPGLSYLDALLTYLSGIATSMGGILMTQYMALCNPPDTYLQDVAKCACGDTGLVIPDARATADFSNFDGLWCTGTLGMIDGSNGAFIVYNPYTYRQLQAMSSGMQAYLTCASQSYHCEPPTDTGGEFAYQGVTLLNVLVKCRENFAKRTWDPMAYVLFDPKQRARFKTRSLIRLPEYDPEGVVGCLLAQSAVGADNSACLDLHLAAINLNLEAYWSYERALPSAPVHMVDACLTFSGPAQQNISVFQNCVDDEQFAGCTLSSHIWSPSSPNNVPVAQPHVIMYHGRQADSLIYRLYNEAFSLVQSAVAAADARWTVHPGDVDAQFFSAEGDIIHQMLDCIFLGPYARVDYWPIPACEDGLECLVGPYWSRDDGAGASRSVDPYSCMASPTIPFTCGSPARRSLVRYYVSNFLTRRNSNVSVFQQAIRLQIQDVWNAWSNGSYACSCADGTQALTCCADAAGDFLPPQLRFDPSDLRADNVLQALLNSDLERLYDLSLERQEVWMQFMDPVESARYAAWNTSRRAADEGRFDPKAPVYEYAPKEAMAPLQTVDSTLWDICHASLKQVFWTLPIDPDTGQIVFGANRDSEGNITPDPLSFDALPYDGDPARLEEYIAALMYQAAIDSPLYRHYVVKHAPSESLMCDLGEDQPPLHAAGTLSFSDYVQATSDIPVKLVSGAELGTFPVYPYQALALGNTRCPCGWPNVGPLCQAPPTHPQACTVVYDAIGRDDCLFWPANETLILSLIDSTWPCPELDLSAHWGLLDAASMEQWLTGTNTLTTSTEDLLRYGRAGVKIGGLADVGTPGFLQPGDRRESRDKARNFACRPPPPPDDLAQALVDMLFPMAQGAEDSGVHAHCLRYTLEVARSAALNLTFPGGPEASKQVHVVSRWRRRCGAQLQLLSLCVNLRVFRPPDPNTNFKDQCGHFVRINLPTVYSTPECLVFINGIAYDPCRCMPCVGLANTSLDLSFIQRTSICRLRFDPREYLLPSPVGWWPVGHKYRDVFADPVTLLSDRFAWEALDAADPLDEGPMNATDDDAMCDMIADWWPDDWDYPVGYHVTVPCHDAAYRTFHQAFGLDVDANGDTILRYQHDLLRPAELVDTNYLGALCRSNVWGFEAYSLNTMRYCTRASNNSLEDYTVYGIDHATPPGWTDWTCSSSASKLPWPRDTQGVTYDPSLHSVGTVPNMPAQGDDYYPADLVANTFAPGPHQDIIADNFNWGSSCSDYGLFTCISDSDCPTSYQCRGRFCRGSDTSCRVSTPTCVCQGVCIESATACVKHSECPSGFMCTGLGECVVPTLVVVNTVDEDYAFQVFSEQCPATSRSFSLLGASHWGYLTTDVLRVHGMCSYGDWYKYQQTISKCSKTDAGDHYEIDPTSCPYIDLDATTTNVTNWWDRGAARPNILFMHPSNCDRDYERLDGFQSCAPLPSTPGVSLRVGQLPLPLGFDQYIKAHKGASPTQPGGVTVPLAKMPYASDPKYGFLGIGSFTKDSEIANVFKPCSNIDQCSASPFTVEGQAAKRVRFDNGNYTESDVFKCGAVGFSDGSQCHVDLAVFPIYNYFCVQRSDSCPLVLSGLSVLCNAVLDPYPYGYAGVSTNVNALNALLNMFNAPLDLVSYLNTIDCLIPLYSFIKSNRYKTLYYALDFVLVEFPFDWFYQCMVMSSQLLNPASRVSQDCPAFQNRLSFTIASYNPPNPAGASAIEFLQQIRGGYTTAYISAFKASNQAAANASIAQVIQNILKQQYGSVDTTYPRCSSNKKWAFGTNYHADFRALIDTFYNSQTCQSSWMEDQIDKLASNGWAISLSDWTDFLTMRDDANLIVQPGWLGTTLLDLIQRFLVSQVYVQPVDLVIGFNTPTNPNLQYRQREAVFIHNTPPDSFTDPVSYSLDPFAANEGDPGEQVYDTPPFACVYDNHYHDDPLLRDLPDAALATCATKDMGGYSIYQCTSGQHTYNCTQAPVNYAINGNFYCGYIPAPVSLCDYSVAAGCGQQLLQKLYAQVVSLYTPPPSASLPPISFPWFDESTTSAWRSSFSFSLSSALDYLGNIMPDKEKSIMCTINTDTLVNLMNCTNQHYQRLKAHVASQFTYNSSVIVPGYAQLEWPVDQQFLVTGGIFAFASTARDPDKTFLKALFNDSSVCTGDTLTHVCWRVGNNSQWNSVNPWHLGYWNPFIECDIDYLDQTQSGAEYINSQCTQQICPNPGAYGNNMPFYATCDALYRTKVSVPGVPASDVNGPLDYNLCHHSLVEDQAGCLHDQSLLGGFDGLPVGAGTDSRPMTYGTKYYSTADYVVSNNMYQSSTWNIPSDYADGSIFDGTNPLWAGAPGLFGFLRVNTDEIGVHRLVFRLTRASNATGEAFSTLAMYQLPLSSADDDQSLPVNQWVPGLPAALQANLVGNAPRVIGGDAACPLRRIAYYSPDLPQFSPTAPSPARASHVFRNITGALGAHPTLAPLAHGEYLGKYVTSNGFCYCPVVTGISQSQCQVLIGEGSAPCSLMQTIKALRGQASQTTVAFTPYDAYHRPAPCTMHVDWPNIPNPMRDGATAPADFAGASDGAARTCHVLDRLYPFQYKYQSMPTSPPSSPGTDSYLQGTCQTRRAATLPASPPSGRCVRGTLSHDQASILCDSSSPRAASLPRRTPLSPRASYQRTRNVTRSRCNQCDPPPRFTSQQGVPIAPESSFGMHYRLSAERSIARDLLMAVCGSYTPCDMLNRSAWKRGVFLWNYVHAPSLLFLNTADTPKPQPAAPIDDSDAWTSKEWVYCPDRASLISGEGCKGTIPRAEWSEGKGTICPNMIKALSSSNGTDQDPLARTSFCLVDSTTAALCAAVAEAQRLVVRANCIAAGNITCLPTPWAYHPASFDASNQEWVYRTVLDYYRLVGSATDTCPKTAAELSQAAYNAQFMQSCPANSMRFFVDIIAIVRVIATDVALIVSMMFSMTLKFLTLLFAGINQGFSATITTAKNELAADYAWLKGRIKSMTDTLFDMLSDMLFSSGQIGTGLLSFLDKTCNSINSAYDWFLHIWCKYIERYMASFFSTFRKGLSMIASGFEILQDFMDEVFQGVLPASFIAKYGTKLFQTKLVEKYSQPTARSKNTLNRVQKSAKVASKSMTSIGKKALVGLGTVGTLLSIGFAAYDTYQAIQGALVYPDNFTLFDFSDVFGAIDDAAAFLTTDQSCFMYEIRSKYNITNAFMPCFSSSLRANTAQQSTLTQTSILPTMCWANAYTSLGQSNLFSCHAGSTCCSDDACTSNIPCDQCNQPSFEGTDRFACNTLTRVCQCAVPRATHTLCSQNQQCGGSSQCVLLSLYGSVSYGTTPCSQCPNTNIYCMVQPTGLPGACSCFTDTVLQQALCVDTSGSDTVVDATKLCGYSQTATRSLSVWQFTLAELAMVQCAQVSQAICSTIWTSDTTSVRMAVAVLPIRLSAGRRLLTFTEQISHAFQESLVDEAALDLLLRTSDWGSVSSPCRELALSYPYNNLSILDSHYALHHCAYWRHVGRLVIQDHNLTALFDYDAFLLSPTDLARALMHRDVATVLLISHPFWPLQVIQYHPYLTPLRALSAVFVNLLEQNEMASKWLQERAEPDIIQSVVLDDREELQALFQWADWNMFGTNNNYSASARRLFSVDDQPNRKLLNVFDDVKVVQEFSSLIAQGEASPPVPNRVAQLWGVGPFSWPPVYAYDSIDACPIAQVTLDVTRHTLLSLINYYANWDAPPRPIDRSFRASLPQINWPNVTAPRLNRSTPRSWVSTVFHWFTDLFKIDLNQLIQFFIGSSPWTLEWITQSLVQCDFNAVLTCSRHSRDLFMSIITFILLYVFILYLTTMLYMPILSTLFFLSGPLFILWYTYGLAPTCVPLLPTCLLQDVLALVSSILPPEITLPPELSCDDNSTACLKSCTELNYTTLFDPIAFAICDLDMSSCAQIASANLSGILAPLGPIQSAIQTKQLVFAQNSTTLLAANRICTLVSWVTAFPFLLLASALFTALCSLVIGFVQLGPAFFALIAQTVAFHRTPDRPVSNK